MIPCWHNNRQINGKDLWNLLSHFPRVNYCIFKVFWFIYFLSSGISVLAECLDCPELKATADDFIHQHFIELYKTDECLQLDAKQVTHLLNQDTLTVRAEDQVYDAAVRWLKYDEPNRQPFMVDILAKVRFPLISKNFLSKTVQAEPLIQDNPECLKMVISKFP